MAEIKPGNPFKQIRVRPAANLERLEEVFVLLTQEPLELEQAERAGAAQCSEPAERYFRSGSQPAAAEKP